MSRASGRAVLPSVSLPFAPDFLNTAPRQHIFAVSRKSNFLSVTFMGRRQIPQYLETFR
jgi:hypothetical protein